MKNKFLYTLALGIILSAVSCKTDAKNITSTSNSDGFSETINSESKMNVKKMETENVSTNTIKTKTPEPKPVLDRLEGQNKSSAKKAKVESTKTVVNNTSANTTEVKSTESKEVLSKVDTKVDNSPAASKKSNEKDVTTEKTVDIQKPEKPLEHEVPVGFPNHKVFDGFLKKYVSAAGVVNYSGMKNNMADLNKYTATLEATKIESSWSRNEKLAFWINAYNAYTIKLILDNYPVKKITDLHGGKPWDKKWIKLDGKTLSLNNIENDIIRPVFNEPRIHFAVNCAAVSCPPILNAAFTPEKLDAQLESQTKKFINNAKHNTIGSNEITISKIFDWYGADFGNVLAYIKKYAKTSVNSDAAVKFNEYNWALNGK